MGLGDRRELGLGDVPVVAAVASEFDALAALAAAVASATPAAGRNPQMGGDDNSGASGGGRWNKGGGKWNKSGS